MTTLSYAAFALHRKLLASGLIVAALACKGDDRASPAVPLPFAVQGDRLAVWNGERHEPLFVKAVNLGVAVPGTLPGELAATREEYDAWFEQMGRLGLNAIRIYTLHYPRFYEAIAAYNLRNAQAPLYILHGIWLDEDNPSDDLFDMTTQFTSGIHEIVDCMHGSCDIPERRGRAFGRYRADISPWVLGYILGREVSPDEIRVTNREHPDVTSHTGDAISLPRGTPSEVWFTRKLDEVVRYERKRYACERPVSVSSWPTLDPMHHPSETPSSTEDLESLDLANIDTHDAPAGFFMSFHAYPYYPDFMSRDPDYQTIEDREGPNPYYGYLLDLKAHYRKHPVLIAEFGVPTGWGNAHFGAAGMDHGGETEAEQGAYAARQMQNILDADCAGGAVFAWIDEWWKRTWLVDPVAFPRERYRLWHNLTSAEQNFGLIAFDPKPPTFERWTPARGDGALRELRADVDAEFFHVRLQLEAAMKPGDTLTLGFDTYGDAVGESKLPGGRASSHRNEFALVWSPPEEPQLFVTAGYDVFGIWHGLSEESQQYRSTSSDSAAWTSMRRLNNVREEAETLSMEVDEIGRLRVGEEEHAGDRRYGVIVDGADIHVRIPWTLLHFTDPSQLEVLDDDRATDAPETAKSEGVALTAWLGDDRLEAPRLRWDAWNEAPETEPREKASFGIFADAMRDLH